MYSRTNYNIISIYYEEIRSARKLFPSNERIMLRLLLLWSHYMECPQIYIVPSPSTAWVYILTARTIYSDRRLDNQIKQPALQNRPDPAVPQRNAPTQNGMSRGHSHGLKRQDGRRQEESRSPLYQKSVHEQRRKQNLSKYSIEHRNRICRREH